MAWRDLKSFREKIAAGKLCLGPAITYRDPAVSEALAGSSDFLWIDMEHSPIGIESLHGHLMAADLGRVPALVRPASSDPAFIKQILDTGAEAIIVPQVRSLSEVRTVIDACRYPPAGRRGFGPRRGCDYGRADIQQYLEQATRELFVSVQIETREALEIIDEILALAGLDSVVIGPQDLAASLGHLGQPHHPEVDEAVRQVVSRARAAGKSVGVGAAASAEDAVAYARLGVQWVMVGCDFLYLTAFAEQLYRAVARQMEAS